MKNGDAEEPLIGAHTSTAGGIQNALVEGSQIGATTIQFFTSNQRQWKGRTLTPEIMKEWEETRKESGLTHLMSHDSYLINLGSPDPEVLKKSRAAFAEEAARCMELEVSYLNFHPGAALESSVEECLNTIVESLLLLEQTLSKTKLRLLLETTAGQGSAVGCRFEDLAYIIQRVEKKIPIGVCIDTCHIFAAGYDIRTTSAWNQTLEEFDRIVGLRHLYAFHLNDSLKELGSRVDRHQPLGAGKIGWDAFKFLMQDNRTARLPKYLETPGGPTLWEQEIKRLKTFYQRN